MAEVRVTVGSRIGLHARPAAIFAKAVAGTALPVRIGRTAADGVDAASVLAMMALGVGAGEEVVLSAEGEGAEAALTELAALLARDLDAAEPAPQA
jgi:phosphocarrier protein HPr